MGASASAVKGSDPDMLMSKADEIIKLNFTGGSVDLKQATPLYEQAAIGYMERKDYEKAKEAFIKASNGHEMISSFLDAAKHMEFAASLAKDLCHWKEASALCRMTSKLYIDCGKSQQASDVLVNGARTLEILDPDESVRLYIAACEILEANEKEQYSFDPYGAATRIYIKLHKYSDAATLLLRWGGVAGACNAVNSQCKAYLSAIIVYLYQHDLNQAQKCYDYCTQIAAFVRSDQNRCANKLLYAYRKGNVKEIKRISKSPLITDLDLVIVRLAMELPKSDLKNTRADT